MLPELVGQIDIARYQAVAGLGGRSVMSEPLVLALPSKGRLKEQAEAWLADCGFTLTASGGARGYRAAIDRLPDVQVQLLSAADIAVALDAGMDSREISFAGPGKSDTELAQAVAAGVMVNIESMREVRLLAEVSHRLGQAARVAVRVNPDFELKAAGMKMGGGPKQFGVDAEQVPEVLAAIGTAGLRFEGFHVFSGSQNLRAAAICEAQTKSLELAARLAEHAPAPVAVGDGAVRFRAELERAGVVVPRDDSHAHRVSALVVCRLGRAREPVDRDALLPDYRREPDAVPPSPRQI